MDDVDALIARASALAGKCHDKKTRQQLLSILDVILSLVETGMAGSSPAPLGAQKPAPPSTHGSGAHEARPPVSEKRSVSDKRPVSEKRPDPSTEDSWAERMRRSTSTKQPQVPSTWSERTRRTRPKASMVFQDWQVAKVGSTDELRSGKGGLLVAASVEDAESAWGAALDTVAVYPEAKVAVVCSVPWDGSVRHLVTLSDGGHQDVWSRFQNLALPTVHCKAVDTLQPTTQVCLFQVRAAYVHAATWDTAMKAAQSVRIMAKKAAEAEGLRMDWSAVFTKVHRRQGVCEVSVRVPIVDVQKLLRSSGKAGTFWKALSFVNGTDTMPAVWVSDCTLEEARRLAALTPNTFGVIAGTKTGVFGIRTTPEHVAATESAVGKKLSKRQLRGDKDVVTTACASEHATDLLAACAAAGWKVEQAGAFKRQGKTVCIVIADTGPPAPVFFRLDRASISIRKYDRSTDARQRKGFSTQGQREKDKLPPEFFASLNERPEPSPGQKRGRTEDETTESQEKLARVDGKDNMVTDCRHTSWQEAHSNAEAFLCVVCAKGMQVGQAKRLCAHGPCQAAICHACWTKSRATPPTSSPSPAQATADVPPPESQW